MPPSRTYLEGLILDGCCHGEESTRFSTSLSRVATRGVDLVVAYFHKIIVKHSLFLRGGRESSPLIVE